MAAASKRRITPIAVDQPVAPTLVLGAELPLDVGPAPDQGDPKAVHDALGAGRRVWVDIQDTWQLKFKQVLRQQGLDYSTWKHGQDEQYAAHYKSLYGQDLGQNKRRPDLLTGMLRRVQGMLQPDDSDEGGSSGDEEDDSDEEGDGDDEEGGDGDGSSDDGEEGGDEIDLDKEAEAEGVRQAANSAKPKRARFERYEDDFIDDSEIEKVKGGPKVRTLYSGFYINKGNLEVIEEPATKQRRKPAPKPPLDPAAAAAAAGGPPAKRRKQQEPQQKQKEGSSQQPSQQQQQQQQQAEGPEAAPKKRQKGSKQQGDAAAAADASDPSEAAGGSRKKRARSETAAAAGAAAAGDGAAAAPASKKARKASPATSDAAAAPAPAAAAAGAGAAGTAKAALAAAMAAAAARKPAAAGGVRGSSPSAALPPAGPSAAGSQPQQGAPTQQQPQQQQQQQQQAQRSRRITPAPVEATAASAAAMSAVFPGASQPEVAEGAAAGGSDAAGLPADITQAAAVLQKAVQENTAAVSGPAASTATRNKVLGAPLSALGLAFARLPEGEQARHTGVLLALVGPLLGHLSDKALRKKLLQEPRDKLAQAQESREKLLEALGGVRGGSAAAAAGGAGGAEGVTSDDDFQQAWSHVAEDSLVTAWAAAKAVGGQAGINQLALEVCEELGNTAVQGQPDKAVAELQAVVNRAKRRQKNAKEESKTIAAATAEAAAALAGADGAPAPAASQQPQQQQQPAAARTPSRQPSPAVGGMAAPAAAAAGGDGGTPAAKGLHGRSSLDSDTGTDEGGAEPDAARESGAGGPADAGGSAGAAKVEWSQWSAPSPRLQRCVAAAKAAGASEEWLADKYGSIRKGSSHGHQAFRILCCAGPAGCTPGDFKAVSDAHELALDVDTSSKGKHGIKQALAGKGLSSIIGITEADPHKRALLAFPGVIQKAAKPAARASTPGPSGQQGEGQQAAAAVQPADA